MGEPVKDAWSEVADGFAKLGVAMRERYRQEGDDAPSDAAESDVAGAQRLREAFERLVAAGRDVGQRSMDVVRDADVNAQAKDAARALNDALAATVDMIGSEVGQLFGRSDKSSATSSAAEEDADDRGQADPAVSAASIDQLLEDAEGGVDGSLLDAPDSAPEPPT